DLELLGKALGHAGHQVRDQRPRHAPHGTRVLRVAWRDLDAAILELGDDVVHKDVLELALRALHRHLPPINPYGDTLLDSHWIFTNNLQRNRPSTISPRTLCTNFRRPHFRCGRGSQT